MEVGGGLRGWGGGAVVGGGAVIVFFDTDELLKCKILIKTLSLYDW